MKLPERPPKAASNDLVKIFLGKEDIIGQLDTVFARANSDYLYWDDFKHKPMPEGIRPDVAWHALKFSARKSNTPVQLTKNVRFTYWLPDPATEHLHYIDRNAGGIILFETPEALAAEREQYVMRSLMEEAIASSQIEGAATTRAVAKEMLRSGRKPRGHAEKMIYNNYVTIQKIKERTREPLSIALIHELHAEITKGTLEDDSWYGKFRTEQNEVHDPEDRVVLYTPPPPSEVQAAMERLCAFANQKDGQFVHPVVKGIILHFWFAWVHPYMDGNGRTARALFHWYMPREGYRIFEFLSVSKSILKKRIQYYKSFLHSELDDNDMTYFIMFNLNAIHDSVEDIRAYIERKEREKRAAMAFLTAYPTLNHRQRALLASALEKPDEHYTIEGHSRVHGVVYQSARTDLLGLQKLGLLAMVKSGRKMVFHPVKDLREGLMGK